MTDKFELIKEKIKKMLEIDYPCDNFEQEIGYHTACWELEEFINSLE